MKNKKNLGLIAIVAVIAILALLWPTIQGMLGEKTKEYPTRDISMTVPFNPGGSTDLTGRALAEPMGKILGTNITVANTPGAGGSVGSLAVKNAPTDGYNLLVDGMLAFTSMPIMDTLKTTYKEWDIWLATFTPNVIAVRKDSPYQTIDDLIADLKSRPGELTAGTAGPGSAGHIAIELLKSALGIEYNHVPYQGGNPAIIATLSGEVDFTPQLLVEMEDMIKAGELRALAAFTTEDIVIKDGPTIPSILKTVSNMDTYLPMGETTGLAVPKGLPENVLAKLDSTFESTIKDESFVTFCNNKGFIITGKNREESVEYLSKLSSVVSWALFDAGIAKVSPEELNIPRP
ncbi:tripartite tricarboxylate transporter substrate binding protein [Lachnoclostridium phytofermentans]|uniref:Tripartite tricarboxylate transporter substrate binding protein n=1 Tax=Lachnoclostridium phytofermentans (strain ATCC 700394 / DSM 18823 / ISDg) TaxID=357809 RepID=A9KIY4_LACP7|nr:tripartite tricarboxylate transporter substrate binding protein [Lachnoclostridium phytofermentans]ABX40983.1 conserved hypothetical protein [Lachnoclostridium phytofermentans ISDg]